ncbi:ribosomal protein [Lithospermum erythrorhizon]|uniref:Ribosomal protein n=1 Tax=Lithospermum erythrorhizon TaxID=34254 RepID=A0AAV3QSM0_LITER
MENSNGHVSTTWNIAAGNLKTTVTFDDDVEASHCLPRSPLILTPLKDHSSPCQIKLCFKQRYEIRQIYVRSTARVYEIYYSPTREAADEYLCTVRCSAAERDGEVLQATAYGNVEDESTTSIGESTKSNSPSESNGSSESDWVEVKNPITSYESADRSLSNNDDYNMGSSIQDLYEATAEINDADPCTSITIRLLSLQNKSRVYVDEVYVFADLVDLTDSENQAVQPGSSTGNALMAMLVPTIMQLSKSSSSQVLEKITSDQTEAAHSEQEEKLRNEQQYMMYDNRAEPNAPQLPSDYPFASPPPPTVENVMSHSRIEGLLEQLVARVSRVEDYFSRFEENILNPMNSMDARISLVEQKLDILVNSSGSFGLQHGTRVSAPSFSCVESNSSSIFDDTSRDAPQMSELKESDTDSTDSCKQSDGSPAADNSPHVLPGFRITAPDLDCSEDDEDGNVYTLENSDVLVSSGGKSLENPKKTVSVDDALANALSGFLALSSRSKSEYAADDEATVDSLTPTSSDLTATGIDRKVPSEYSEVSIIRAPKFTIEVLGDEELLDSRNTYPVSDSEYMIKENGTLNTISLERDKFGTPRIALDASMFTDRETIATDISGRSSDKQLSISSVAGEAKILTEVDAGQATEKSSLAEFNKDMFSAQSETIDKSYTPENDVGSVECVGNEAADINALLNITELPVSSVVDLEFPILEVKFDPHGSSMTRSPLEALLYDVSNIHIRTCSVGSLDEAEFTSDDGSRADDLPTDYNLLGDMRFDDIEEVSNSSTGLHDPFKSSNNETVSSLI